jgi:hypothetical protein
LNVSGHPSSSPRVVDAAVAKGVGSGGALGNADGVEEVVSDGASDSVASDDPGAGDDAVVQAATKTRDRTSHVADRNNRGASVASETRRSRTCYA